MGFSYHVTLFHGERSEEEEGMVVGDVMSTGVVTAKVTDTVRSVVGKMLSRHCGAIPVVDDEGKLLGLVAVRDVMIPLYPNYGDYIHDNVHSRDHAYPVVTLNDREI